MTDLPSNLGVTRYHHSLCQCDMVESPDGIYVLYEALVNENKARVDIAKELARVTDAYYRVLGQLQQVETAAPQPNLYKAGYLDGLESARQTLLVQKAMVLERSDFEPPPPKTGCSES